MIAYYILFAVAFCGLSFCLITDDRARRPFLLTYLAFAILALTLFAGLRSPHLDADYQNYVDWFSQLRLGAANSNDWMKDPAFAVISFVTFSAGLTYFPIPLIYAFLALSAKTIFTFLAATERAAAMYFFLIFCRFFVLLEMTQIRASVAIPLMSIAVYLACTQRRVKAILVYLLALTFHLSVAIGLPIFVLVLFGARFQSRNWVLAFAPLALVAALLLRPFSQQLFSVYRVSEYLGGQQQQYNISLISFHFFLHVGVIAIVLVACWKYLSLFDRTAVIYSAFGVFLYTVFIAETTLATRFEQIFDLFWLSLLVMIFNKIPNRWHLPYLVAVGMLGFVLFQSTIGIIKPYAFWDAIW